MPSLNKVLLIGHVGGDPTLRDTANGTPVANFSVATNENYKDKNGNKRTHTAWHQIVVWGPLALACDEYLAKGNMVYVEGRLGTQSYEDKEGVARTSTQITANQVLFLTPKDANAA